MALEWVVLTYAAAAEAIMVLLLTLPGITPIRKGLLTVTNNFLKPLSSIVPFCIFLLLDIYWKFEHMPISCRTSSDEEEDVEGKIQCGPVEFLRYEKSLVKSQRNFLLVMAALLFYWVLRAVTKFVEREEEMKVSIQRLKNKVQ